MPSAPTGPGPDTPKSRGSYRGAVAGLRPSALAEVLHAGLNDPDILPLWLGETDLATPEVISAAAIKALQDGHTRYMPTCGMPALRQGLGDYLHRIYGVRIDTARICVPGSAMLCIHLVLQSLVREGDAIVVVTPQWPNIMISAQSHGAHVRLVDQTLDLAGAAPRWRLDLEQVFDACDARTRAIFIGSPANPTGWTMTPEDQAALLDFVRTRQIALIADEVYGRLTFQTDHAPSMLPLITEDDPVFVINSFSKLWAMTGWRLGWMVHPRGLSEAFVTLSGSANTGAAAFTQFGALAALEQGEPFVDTMRAHCRAGLDVVTDHLAGQNRLRMARPDGAFYGFIDIDGLTDSVGFAKALLAEERVGVAPGAAFGPAHDGRIRICFAQSADRVREGLTRLSRFVSARI